MDSERVSAETDSQSFNLKSEEIEFDIATFPQPLRAQAYHGLSGKIVKSIEPYTEADPAALLMSFITAFGNIIDKAHLVVDGRKHHLNFFFNLVGESARSRKGTSYGIIESLIQSVNPDWVKNNIITGLSSGEGLIYHVRDETYKKEPIYENSKGTNKQIIGYQDILVDEGVTDKRRFIIEEEFASPLKIMAREGNTLSTAIRCAWDHKNLQIMTRNSPYKASTPHISILGHITREELTKYLSQTDALNGFANRFLWVCVRRSKILPLASDKPELNSLISELQSVLSYVETVQYPEMQLSPESSEEWSRVDRENPGLYQRLTEDGEGLTGAILARAEAQVLRLSAFYAIMDKSLTIELEHLLAALAIWTYCIESTQFIFGSLDSNPIVTKIMEALKKSSLTQTEIYRDVFQNHKTSREIKEALQGLSAKGRIEKVEKITSGKPAIVWQIKKLHIPYA